MKPQKWANAEEDDIKSSDRSPPLISPLSAMLTTESEGVGRCDSTKLVIPIPTTQTGEGEGGGGGVIKLKSKDEPLATEVLIILKWGGDLTPLGREQAERLGMQFRHQMYPDHKGGGVLRLHATYRHDLKIKASDEGRVMKTAAAFTKGLLELEGQLTPILASLVTVEDKNRQMLDRGGNCQLKNVMDKCKEHLNMLQTDCEMTEEIVERVAAGCPVAVKRALLSLKNPLKTLRRMHVCIGQLCAQVC